MATIVLAEDHHIVRQGLRALLQTEPDLQVIGEAGDGPEAVNLLERLKPDVLVLDLMMPGLGGVEVTRQARRLSPQTRVVILSMHANEAYVLDALSAGAVGYVLKRSTASDLVQAIRAAIEGRRYLSPPLADRLLDTYLQTAKPESLDPYNTLTNRERQVLPLAAAGYSNAEIAERLTISTRTVEMHRGNLMNKLNLHTAADLIRYALHRGILHVE